MKIVLSRKHPTGLSENPKAKMCSSACRIVFSSERLSQVEFRRSVIELLSKLNRQGRDLGVEVQLTREGTSE